MGKGQGKAQENWENWGEPRRLACQLGILVKSNAIRDFLYFLRGQRQLRQPFCTHIYYSGLSRPMGLYTEHYITF